MIFLLLSIACSTTIIIVFKLFAKFKVKTFEAIVINYLVAAGLGFSTMEVDSAYIESVQRMDDWVIAACILGVLFIVLFNVMALSAQRVGITWTAIANNMSVVVPVVAAVLLYQDAMPWLKIVGIVLALVGVYLATKPSKAAPVDKKHIWLPIVLFFGSGAIATLIDYTNHLLEEANVDKLFVPTIFVVAGAIGLVVMAVRAITGKGVPGLRSLVAGLALGIPNYGSIMFVVLALDSKVFQSSEFFPINNMSVVAFSALLAFIFFKEKLSLPNWIGIVISIIAIGIIAFHNHLVPA